MTLVMGIVNVTPDSFSDGGRWFDPAAAIAHGRELVAAGAAIVDVGGESTRPGANRVSEHEELTRVLPVVEALAADGVAVSVDTMRSSVARACVKAGASIVNDVSGGLADDEMAPTVADLGVDFVLMHWRGHSRSMQQLTDYGDVVGDVASELASQRDRAVAAGVQRERIILDPGIGFSKTGQHNWELLRHLDALQALGHRLLVGVSRKRFLGDLLGAREASGRDIATAAVSAWCALQGVWGVRTHEVTGQLDAIAVAQRLR